ncbi:MAG: glycosyltransferase family 4 protein [Anaerolineae bacterium]|nr:glycosyltransferase family 4 protein [Anaerolineae bacterium]
MKIAVNAWFADMPTNGTGQYTHHLINALREVAPHIELELVRPRRVPSGLIGDLAKIYFEQVEFPRQVKALKADVAFVPYWGPPMSCAAPVVCTVHDVISLAMSAYRGKMQHRAYSSLARAAAANAAAIITDSEFSKADILRLMLQNAPQGGPSVTVVPLAAEARFPPAVPSADQDRARERYQLPERYVLYLGGLDTRKNIETLLQVYTWCGESIGDEYPLVMNALAHDRAIAADGSATTLGEMLKALELEDVVRLIGRVDEADKPALYAGARCFLFASIYEGFGLPPLEAMSCGVPVVGSNATSLPEVVGNAGMLVDAMDARAMSGALIATCIEDDLHDRLAQRALLRAAQFSWQRTALETLTVFKRVLEK